MKIAICAIIKNENLYLREWVEHHKNLGFDKIILYFNLMKYDKTEYDTILVSWMTMGDNQLYYEDIPVKERFNKVISNNTNPNNGIPMGLSSLYVKPILKTNANKGFIESIHCPAYSNPCTSKVGPINMNGYVGVSALAEPVWEVMYIKHYCIKSFSEYLCRRLTNNQLNRFDEYKQVLGWSEQHQKMYDYMKKYMTHQWK